jgi:hypothetical protein
MSIITRIPNPEHMARAAAAIRERWESESTFEVGRVEPARNVLPMRKRVAK